MKTYTTATVAGCNLGKASASFSIATVSADGTLSLSAPTYVLHEGKPFEVFERWYREHDVARCDALAATGLYAAELARPVLVLPEDTCQEAALDALPDFPDALNLLSVGARGYGVLAREHGHVRYLENDKCSSGTGENLQKIASRFGLSLAEADALAAQALESTPITARCSVFAKSEMTHYANQGKPASALFAGYFDSVARNTFALLTRNRVAGPVYLIGGCAQLGAFRRALVKLAGDDLRVPEHFLAFEAIGAAALAAEQLRRGEHTPLPASPDELVQRRAPRLEVLAPAHESRDRVTIMAAPHAAPGWQSEPAVLGLDLGSTGAKAVLTSVATGEPLLDVYDRTRGNPVDASRRLIRAILDQGTPDVRAIGLTGSGREAVATLCKAVYAEGEAERVVVLNEIVAHATSAIRCDADDGDDLSVIEIGGQDAKYIRISGGRIVESDMNKACSAGTGSFLEEQAQLYDVHDIARFVELARDAKRPPDLGQMCTVYVADAGGEALKAGFELGDIFAGFQYSIIHNYLDRVMGQRTLGARVFFQGKPASNPSLAWTLATITDRDIVVPPNPGAMGAWGIGLCALQELSATRLADAAPLDLEGVLRAQITERSEFQCRDKECQTLCPIERTTIRVADVERVAISGGACPKFEVAGATAAKLEKTAPNPFDARAALLDELERPGARGTIAIPLVGPLVAYAPWLATLVHALGYGVRLLRSDGKTLARGEQLCNSFDSCGPAKIAHAVCETDARLLLFPKITDIGDPTGRGGQSCVTEQALPDIVEASLRSRGVDVRVLRPVLSFNPGTSRPATTRALLELVEALAVTPFALHRAVGKAAAAQRAFERRLLELGDEALAYARARDLPSVVVCGPAHVIHDRAINATIPTLLRQNGAMAIPMDCMPIDAATPAMSKVYWGDPNRYLRAAAAARDSGDVFPLMLSSFGCGPASFTEHVFQSLLEGYPHTILESDGHGGTAGFVTRIQAFLQSVRQFRAVDRPALPDNSAAVSYVEPAPRTGSYLDRSVRYVFLSSVDFLGDLFAAAYRSYGYDAVVAPPLSHANFECGRRDCSGKECLSYQFVWGAFREYLEANPPPPDRETRLVQISGESCRASLFGVKDRISLAKLGYDNVTVTSLRIAGGAGMSARLWAALVASDLVRQMYLYHLVAGRDDAHALYQRYGARLVALLERPVTRGWGTVKRTRDDWRELTALVDELTEAFARLGRRATIEGPCATVFVSGDIMTKGNDFANGGAYHYLATRGVRTVVEPTCDFIEFLARAHPHLLFGRGASKANNLLYTANMVVIRKRLYERARAHHPWLPMPDVKASLRRASRVIDLATNGGAALAVGSVLHHWESGRYDGAVMTACWGCDNGLIGESLLRHERDIPIYFLYDDATPIDQRKLDSFAFRIARSGGSPPSRGDRSSRRHSRGRRTLPTVRSSAP